MKEIRSEVVGEVLHKKVKDPWKPDNRLVINYAKSIVDAFSSYQIGVSVKVTHDNTK
ncbi:phage portal protein [Streptococcus danieliae]|uniref:Phage portal protein n=1 Tax=Streptococcus danieliae TaxID=747656 RepID=A0A7Z0M6T4_9STRE|nr:phage portal protein [Streptococcus danieliae]MBF0699271.1 phage portal protein [Streptococcus danieliae]NYS96447.1 phage portal protein [Streptococcus danieliae]